MQVATHAGNLSKHPHARLVTAYDINPAQMDAFVKKFPEVKPAASVEEVVNNPEVGFIVITSPAGGRRPACSWIFLPAG